MAKKSVERKDLSHVNIPMLKNYGSAYQNTADTAIADKAVEEFLNNYKDWKEVVGCWVGEDGERLYGAALCTFSGNLYLSSRLTKGKSPMQRKVS